MPALEESPRRRGASVPGVKTARQKVLDLEISLVRSLAVDSADPDMRRAAKTRLREVRQEAAALLLNVTDLAAHFGVSRPFIYQARREGYQFTHGRLTEAASFKAWLSRRPVPPKPEPAPAPAPVGTPDGR